MHRVPLTSHSDSSRIEHFFMTVVQILISTGGYGEIGDLTIRAGTPNHEIMSRLMPMLSVGFVEFSVFDPERGRHTEVAIEKLLTKRGIFGDKHRYRIGFQTRDGGGERVDRGYLVGKGFPDTCARAMGVIGTNFETSLLDEQASLIAMQT